MIPVIAPIPLIYPYRGMFGVQFGLLKIKQSSVTFILNFNSPSISVGLFGTGKVPISHTNVPLLPIEGLKIKLLGAGRGIKLIVPLSEPLTKLVGYGISILILVFATGSVPSFKILIEYSNSSPGKAVKPPFAGCPLIVIRDITPSASGIYASTAKAAKKITYVS